MKAKKRQKLVRQVEKAALRGDAWRRPDYAPKRRRGR
jgi:hypothetical protein